MVNVINRRKRIGQGKFHFRVNIDDYKAKSKTKR